MESVPSTVIKPQLNVFPLSDQTPVESVPSINELQLDVFPLPVIKPQLKVFPLRVTKKHLNVIKHQLNVFLLPVITHQLKVFPVNTRLHKIQATATQHLIHVLPRMMTSHYLVYLLNPNCQVIVKCIGEKEEVKQLDKLRTTLKTEKVLKKQNNLKSIELYRYGIY